MGPITMGVLAMQGSFAEHLEQAARLEGVRAVPVRTVQELEGVDAMILPGGESTAMRRLMAPGGFAEALKQRILTGMPVWGTCAGMILLAETVVGEAPHLGVMATTVGRNAYGTQLDSFSAVGRWLIDGGTTAEMINIRAPRFEAYREPAKPAAEQDGMVTAVVQDHMLATAFHPELSGDLTPYRWLKDKVLESLAIQDLSPQIDTDDHR